MSTRTNYIKVITTCPMKFIKIANVIYVRKIDRMDYCAKLIFCVYFRVDVKICYKKGGSSYKITS